MVLATFALIMLVIIVLLMNNTIKLAIYSQRFLIRSMQLVGATNGFIQMPFLKKGAVQGLISGVVAAGLIFGLLQLGLYLIEGLHILQENTKLVILLVGVVILGVLIGVASTYQSLYRYLRMALDDLY
jgi:cell division transport system permease protein